VFQLTLVDPATVSVIVGMTIMPMTGATGLRGLPDGNHRASRKHAHDQTLRLAVGRACSTR